MKSDWWKTLERVIHVRNALAAAYQRHKSKGITNTARESFTLTQLDRLESSLDYLDNCAHAEIGLAIGKCLNANGISKVESLKGVLIVNGEPYWFALNPEQANEQ